MLISMEKDKAARHLAHCFVELKDELEKANQEFGWLCYLSELSKESMDASESILLAPIRMVGGEFLINYIQSYYKHKVSKPSPYMVMFEDILVQYDASATLTHHLKHLKVIHNEKSINISEMMRFIQKLQQYLLFYLAAIHKAPRLFVNFQKLTAQDQKLLNDLAQEHGFNLQGHFGILIHLFQHCGRIPLLLKTMTNYANDSDCPNIQQLKKPLSLLAQASASLIKEINKLIPKLKA